MKGFGAVWGGDRRWNSETGESHLGINQGDSGCADKCRLLVCLRFTGL